MKSNYVDVLFSVARPFVHFSEEVSVPSIATYLPKRFSKMLLAELDGSNMRTERLLFKAYDLAFHDGGYRLENWDAFIDVMRTVDEITLHRDGCVTFIRNADDCLRSEKNGLVRFGNVMETLGLEWSQPVSHGEWWDRGPKAFHTVFLFQRKPRSMPNAAPIWLGVHE
ncbi:MAG: barstar family protein [Hyphomicrobiales bacterium]